MSHLIEDIACEDGLSPLPCRSARSKAIPDDRLVPEEGVLDPGLLMVARGLLPPSPSDRLHLLDRAITSARPRSASGHRCGLGRRNHDGRATCTGRIVEGDRVVGRVRGDAATSPWIASISLMAVVASSTVASVSAWATMTPDRSTPT